MATRDDAAKRDFDKTPEPRGDRKGKRGDRPIFVIQEHDASTRHWDFRLEVDGVLKSWAVPKGPSTDPSDKRLAMPTEDHPLGYADFEGTIPAGEYGAGSVIVWDTGPYDNITEKDDGLRRMAEAIADGHVLVRLHGEKLNGGYALQRTGGGGGGGEGGGEGGGGGDGANWLLVKMRDDDADARRNPTSTEPKSVLSGRTVEQVAKDAESADEATR